MDEIYKKHYRQTYQLLVDWEMRWGAVAETRHLRAQLDALTPQELGDD